MNTERPVEDRIRSWLLETAPAELPDRVFDATFERTQSMSQASGVRPWRTPSMNPLARMAAAFIAVVLVIGTGAYLLGQGPQNGGTPTSSPSISATAVPTSSAKPSASPLATPSSSTDATLDTTTWTPFTSPKSGYRDAVPPGYETMPAKKFWTIPEGPMASQEEWDILGDPFEGYQLAASSIALPAGTTFELFAADYRARSSGGSTPAECDATKQKLVPITIDDTPAELRVGCKEMEALLVKSGRVYSFAGWWFFSNTVAVPDAFRSLFDMWLTTIKLDPSSALAPPAPSPSPS